MYYQSHKVHLECIISLLFYFSFTLNLELSLLTVFNAIMKLHFSKRMRENVESEFSPEMFLEWLVVFRLFLNFKLFLC